MSAHPGIGDLAREPERAAAVPLERVPDLLADLARVHAILLARLMEESRTSNPGAIADRNLSVEEAAARLGVKRSYLYRHAGSLPFTVRIGRRLLFSSEGLERWNRRRQGR